MILLPQAQDEGAFLARGNEFILLPFVEDGDGVRSLDLEKSLPHLTRLSRRALKVRVMGSAALELAYVASGRLDAYIERTINLWDIAAGALMVECSGGEFYTRSAPGGKFRMVADNGRLRRKLQLGNLLK